MPAGSLACFAHGEVMLTYIWHGRLGGLRLIMILAVAALLFVGLACIHATGQIHEFNKQLMYVALGFVVFIVVNLFHYRKLGPISYLLFVLTLFLLGIILAGKYLHVFPSIIDERKGVYRWITIPGLPQIQPSEIAKLTYILALAWYMHYRKSHRSFLGLIGPFAMTVLPMGLIVVEPDLGTTLLFPPVLFAILFVAGARLRHLLTILFVGIVLAAPAFFLVLKPYQQNRIEALFHQNTKDPTRDSFWRWGPSFHLYQSKIFVGSGQLTGQDRHSDIYLANISLPESHNDFIFPLIAHQWGFIGCMAVLSLYVLIIMGGVAIADQQTEPFGRLLALGIAASIAVQAFINVGMTIGLMPITGLTLPFVSYGGSSLLSNFLALGLLVNVARRQPPHQIARRSFEFDS